MSVTRSKVDKFGRVLIPKAVRQTMGFQPGDPVKITTEDGKMHIAPSKSSGGLVRENGLLVWDGELPEGFDIEQHIQDQRDQRMRDVLGNAKP